MAAIKHILVATSLTMPRKLTKGITPRIKTKRVYEPVSPEDGTRFLVERLWPRGIKKADLHAQEWLKEAAPSDSLRRWFHHDPEKWSEFERRYFDELDNKQQAIEPLCAASRGGEVTLLYSSRDNMHNNAVALQEYLTKHCS